MNFHPFVSGLIIAAAALIFGCSCADCSMGNKYVKVCRMDSGSQDCYEFKDVHVIQGKTMITIQDGHNKYSFNKSGWSILVMDKGERNRR